VARPAARDRARDCAQAARTRRITRRYEVSFGDPLSVTATITCANPVAAVHGTSGSQNGGQVEVGVTVVRDPADLDSSTVARLWPVPAPRLAVEEPAVAQAIAVGIACTGRVEPDRLADLGVKRHRRGPPRSVHPHERIVVGAPIALHRPGHPCLEVVLERLAPAPDGRLVRRVPPTVDADHRVLGPLAGEGVAALRPDLARLAVRLAIHILDGEAPGPSHGVDVDEDGTGVLREGRLYQLVREHGAVHQQTLEITFLEPGVEAYAFTFG